MVLSQQLFVCLLSRGSQVRVLYGGLPPLAQLVEHRNTTQQHRNQTQLLCPSWSKEMDLSSIGVLLRAGSKPCWQHSLDGSQQLLYIFLVFTHDGRVRSPRWSKPLSSGDRTKSTHPANFIRVPHSKYSRKPNFSFDHAITMVLAII